MANTLLLNQEGNYNVPKILNDEEVTVTRLIDLTSVTLNAALQYSIFKIPKRCIVTNAYISVLSVAGSAVTCALKNVTTGTIYIAAADLNNENGVTAITTRELCDEAIDQQVAIDLSANNSAAKFYVTLKYIPLTT